MIIMFTPKDLAVFFYEGDFKRSQERDIIQSVWKNDNDSIPVIYREDLALFIHDVYLELSKLDDTLDDVEELKSLKQIADISISLDGGCKETGIIDEYFRNIKLVLLYVPGKKLRRTKLKNLLKRFGYQRRPEHLVNYIKALISALGLNTYSKDNVPCDITQVCVDDMIIIRLAQSDK